MFDFYQFWLNADDAGVIYYMKIYTLLSKEEIEDLERQTKENPAARAAQKKLAYEITKIVHGTEAADKAVHATEALFAGGDSELTPTVDVAPGEYGVAELLVRAGLAVSNSEARRLLQQGGVKLNQEKVGAETLTVKSGDLLQVGKRKFAKIA